MGRGEDGRVRRANVQGIECWASSVSIEEEVGVVWLQYSFGSFTS